MSTAANQLELSARWVAFSVDSRRFALPLDTVERVVRAAEYTALPLAPEVVLGAIDIAGEIVPVFSLRRRFQLADRPLTPADQFVIARSSRRRMVLVVDAAQGLIEQVPGDATPHVPDLPHLRGALSGPDGLVLIQDLERFLSAEESGALDVAMKKEKEGGRRAR